MTAVVVLCGRPSHDECRTAAEELRAALGPEPGGAALEIRPAGRPSRSAYEVVCHYDRDVPGSMEYAYRCRVRLLPPRRASRGR